MAECVLYYYLTKKNENYKSLVRRSYRRRGKGQVRRGRGGLPGGLPACSGAACGDISCFSAAGPSVWAPSLAAGRPSLGVFLLSQQQRRDLGEMAASTLSLENSRTPGLVTHRPCGGLGSHSQSKGRAFRMTWAGLQT